MRRFAQAAIVNMMAWFVNPATRMYPDLRYAQAVQGVARGRSYGIIDSIQLIEVARSVSILEHDGVLPAADARSIKQWFEQYLHWLTTSRMGKQEMNAANNHGTCWVMQVAEFAKLVNNRRLLRFCRNRFKTILLPRQMAANGSFPRELARTKPYCYSLFNLDAMCTICRILSTPQDDLWTFKMPDGRCIRLALKFLYPYIVRKSAWPYDHDIEYWKYWPVRSASLLFAGLAYHNTQYLKLWHRLRPPTATFEVERNVPIRQPLLWFKEVKKGNALLEQPSPLKRGHNSSARPLGH